MTGGYKIIDLEGLDLANIQLDSNKIEKIFSDIESTYKTKALLFDNYKINGIEQNATFSSAVVKNSGFEITLGDYKLLIKNDSVEDSTLHLYRFIINFSDTYFETIISNKYDLKLGRTTIFLEDKTLACSQKEVESIINIYNTNKINYSITSDITNLQVYSALIIRAIDSAQVTHLEINKAGNTLICTNNDDYDVDIIIEKIF